jgi:imidazolonepropionase-like amidohydrolase
LPQADLSDERPNEFVLSNLTLVQGPGQKIENAYVHVKGGKIESTGGKANKPIGIQEIDLQGAWLYPSFIEINSSYGLNLAGNSEAPKTRQKTDPSPQYDSKRAGNYLWNQALMPEFNPTNAFTPNFKEAAEWRKNGFGYAVSASKDGIMRGSGLLCQLGEEVDLKKLIVNAKVLQSMSFQKGSSPQQYPSSQMGAIALLRQTFLDLEWYQKSPRKTQNLGLEALSQNKGLPILFETQQKYEWLRAARLAKEFGLQLLIKGKGDEYQRADEIKATGFPAVLTLQMPNLPDVEDPLDAEMVNLSDMKHWELAPFNARLLVAKNIPILFTASDLKDQKTFWTQIRKMVENGLSKDAALAALTTSPAKVIKQEAQLGQIKAGMWASFFSASGDVFENGSILGDHWVMGKRHAVNPILPPKTKGDFRLKIGKDSSFTLKINQKDNKTEVLVMGPDTLKNPSFGNYQNGKIFFQAQLKKVDSSRKILFSGWETSSGFAGMVSGGVFEGLNWTATKMAPKPFLAKSDTFKKKITEIPSQIWFPFQAYGTTKVPVKQDFAITNATIWTCEQEGKLENADLLVLGGKIQKVGKNLAIPTGILKIDGTGKHLSPGIIDEHSHIAISKGVNEGSSTTSSEVRIGDVVEADDINIFRHLAGGVTAVQQLHGSANTIGGQSSLIKMRWGLSPEEMKIPGADGFIKFALGENVKQSNWGEAYSIRYPQTRMGVEQLLYDAFHQAKKYQKERDLALKNPKSEFKRDLKLEALAEILEKKRFISCHSYVQSEINMLMHVGDSMGFRVNTFTHILEGYKVADKMKKHGAGASTFSDWWAYKMEVKDAIPYNAALMHQAGLTVAINSDDVEMARRLNQEAAKAMKYGGVSADDALKMVTLNPAKLLHLDKQMGSIKEGKDADLVLWSADPLSIYAQAEKTFVDGVLYFDREEAKKRELEAKFEKQRIAQKMILAKQQGLPANAVQPKVQHLWHCDDEGE